MLYGNKVLVALWCQPSINTQEPRSLFSITAVTVLP